MDYTIVIKGLTIDLPGRDAESGRRIAKLLEDQLSRMQVHTPSRGARSSVAPIELQLGASASDHEIVRSVVDAVGRSLQRPTAQLQTVEPGLAHGGRPSPGANSAGREPRPAGASKSG